MRTYLTIIILFLSYQSELFGQNYKLDNEKIIFTFKTNKGKIVSLCSDSNERYIVYRFGTSNKIELEYPKQKDKSSWEKFTYSYYFRGGGTENEGMDMNYVSFKNGGFKYTIYDTYVAREKSNKIGIKVISKSATINIIGDDKSRKGSIVDFRYNKLLAEDEEAVIW